METEIKPKFDGKNLSNREFYLMLFEKLKAGEFPAFVELINEGCPDNISGDLSKDLVLDLLMLDALLNDWNEAIEKIRELKSGRCFYYPPDTINREEFEHIWENHREFFVDCIPCKSADAVGEHCEACKSIAYRNVERGIAVAQVNYGFRWLPIYCRKLK